MWPVSTSHASVDLDRSVVVGEADGRWLWLVLVPASAVLLLTDAWLMRDVSDEGPHLVAMPFEGPGPVWYAISPAARKRASTGSIASAASRCRSWPAPATTASSVCGRRAHMLSTWRSGMAPCSPRSSRVGARTSDHSSRYSRAVAGVSARTSVSASHCGHSPSARSSRPSAQPSATLRLPPKNARNSSRSAKGVGHPRSHVREALHVAGLAAAQAALDEHHAVHTVGVGAGQEHGGVAAERLADHGRRGGTEVVQHGDHVGDVRLAGHVVGAAGAAAVAALLDRDHAVVLTEPGDRGAPLQGVPGEAVEEDEDREVAPGVEVPDLGIGPLHPTPAVRHGHSEPPGSRAPCGP